MLKLIRVDPQHRADSSDTLDPTFSTVSITGASQQCGLDRDWAIAPVSSWLDLWGSLRAGASLAFFFITHRPRAVFCTHMHFVKASS